MPEFEFPEDFWDFIDKLGDPTEVDPTAPLDSMQVQEEIEFAMIAGYLDRNAKFVVLGISKGVSTVFGGGFDNLQAALDGATDLNLQALTLTSNPDKATFYNAYSIDGRLLQPQEFLG